MIEPMSKRMTDLAARGRAVTYEAKRAIMARLLRAWDAAPALRLGQLLVTACERHDPPLPLFAAEDERLANMVEAMTVVPEAETLTPSEKTLAKMLAAWDELPNDSVSFGSVIFAIGHALHESKYVDDDAELTADARDLIARARKAGVL